MYNLTSHITINGRTFTACESVRVKKSMHTIVQEAEIQVPLRCRLKSSDNNQESVITESNTVFNRGDYVIIRLGYDGNLQEEFSGFVRTVGFSNPCVIECEGYSYQLRVKEVSGSWKSISMKDLLSFCVTGTGIELHPDCSDITMNNVTIPAGSTAWDVVEFVQKNYHLSIYFLEAKKLYAGPFATTIGHDVKYAIGHDAEEQSLTNIIGDNNLVYRRAEDVKIKVTVRYQDKAGKVSTVTEGDEDGQEIVRDIDTGDASVMKLKATQVLNDYKVDGYDGSITTFLVPLARISDKAVIKDLRYPDRSGNYLIEGTEVTYGTSGARRIIDLGKRLS